MRGIRGGRDGRRGEGRGGEVELLKAGSEAYKSKVISFSFFSLYEQVEGEREGSEFEVVL